MRILTQCLYFIYLFIYLFIIIFFFFFLRITPASSQTETELIWIQTFCSFRYWFFWWECFRGWCGGVIFRSRQGLLLLKGFIRWERIQKVLNVEKKRRQLFEKVRKRNKWNSMINPNAATSANNNNRRKRTCQHWRQCWRIDTKIRRLHRKTWRRTIYSLQILTTRRPTEWQ